MREALSRHAILTLHNATKEDAGAYRCVVENELGFDSATIQVFFLFSLLLDIETPRRSPSSTDPIHHATRKWRTFSTRQ